MWNFPTTAFMEQQQQYVVVATPVCGWNAKEEKLQSFRATATAAAVAGCTLVSVSRCAKVVQKLYQSKFHSKYLGYPRASQFDFIFSCSLTQTRPYPFEAVNCFQKNVQELEPYIALDVIFRPFPPRSAHLALVACNQLPFFPHFGRKIEINPKIGSERFREELLWKYE